MKKIRVFLIIALGALLVIAFKQGDTDSWKVARFNEYWTPNADTITDTENDTLTNTDVLSGFYYYNYAARTTEIADTVLTSIYLEENNTEAGTEWYRVDTLSFTNQGFGRIYGGPMYGLRHRLIVDGTSANQDFRYVITATYKWDK
jgi:hypothetical protein